MDALWLRDDQEDLEIAYETEGSAYMMATSMAWDFFNEQMTPSDISSFAYFLDCLPMGVVRSVDFVARMRLGFDPLPEYVMPLTQVIDEATYLIDEDEALMRQFDREADAAANQRYHEGDDPQESETYTGLDALDAIFTLKARD